MSLYFWETKTLYIPPFLPATIRVLDIHSYQGGTKMISGHFRLLNNMLDHESVILRYLYFTSVSIFCYLFTSTPLQSGGKYCTFHSIHLFHNLSYQLLYGSDAASEPKWNIFKFIYLISNEIKKYPNVKICIIYLFF